MNNNRIVVQSTHEKTHVENCFLLAKYACPPLVSKKLQAPPGDSFAYYYRPPLAEGQGGVWDLQANAAPTWDRRPRPPMLGAVVMIDATKKVTLVKQKKGQKLTSEIIRANSLN